MNNYDCYAYFCIEHAHKTFPIRNAEHHLEKIIALKEGDVLYLKGLGELEVISLNIDNYDYPQMNYLYQEIAISCEIVE
jgi:hypothetical protein